MSAKRKPRTSAQILKHSFGRNKAFLDALPLDKLEFTQNEAPELDGCYNEHILRLGHILDESDVRHELFAYLTISGVNEVLPEIHFFGAPPSDQMVRSFKASSVVAKASIREEFRPGLRTTHEFSTLLKACFFLHGVTLSRDVVFTASFSASLRRVCRRYQGDSPAKTSRLPSVQDQSLNKRVSFAPPLAVKASARKSEQRSLSNPRFDALYFQPSSSLPPLGTPLATLLAASHQPEGNATNANAGYAEIGAAPSAPLAMRHVAARIRDKTDHVTSRGFSKVSLEGTPSTSHDHVRPRSLQAPVMPQLSMTKTSMSTSEPKAAQTRLNEVLVLHQKKQEVEMEINNAKAHITTISEEWSLRREELVTHINFDVTKRHEEERAALKAQQEKEVAKLNAGYADKKRNHLHAVHVLEQAQKAKIQELEGLERALAAKTQDITTEEALEALFAQNSVRKRKREDDIQGGQ
ncbi:hypothetical protein DE146DRAFT_787705 [Phaeosphaeria sp. MPI-PUGE-AT-0046c]|nr:hypothetical protein DE146DRAFT_787705 [Phaeosphaeria sp. MPI-PUGE-AT-0046c]